MDKINKYRELIIPFMTEQVHIRRNRKNATTYFLIDQTERHFQLVNSGFSRKRRIYGCFIHLRIADDGKVWIEQDGTDLVVAEVLENLGVPKEDIVLGFHDPSLRQYTDYALA